MRGLLYRIFLACVNIIFPPAAVMMLCGPNYDCMLNCVFFLLAVIPSHVHGFYISCTYFHRRRKVRRGRYPGGAKSMIHSRYVLNGGASTQEVERLYRMESGGSLSRRSSKRSSKGSIREGTSEMMQRQPSSSVRRTTTDASRRSTQRGRLLPNPTARYDSRQMQHVVRDGYGPPLPQ